MNAVEQLWIDGRRRARAPFDARRPSPGITAVLLAMAAGPVHGGAIARAAEQDQGNTSRWLSRLERFEYVHRLDTVAGLGNQGGGRPAVIWALTGRGRELVAALRAEKSVAT